MEQIANYFYDVLLTILQTVDWFYLVLYMATGYLILKGLKLNERWPKFRKRWQILIIGVLIGVAFGFYHVELMPAAAVVPYGFTLFFTFVIGQFINLYGVEPFIENKLWPFLKQIGKKIKNAIMSR